MTSTDQPRRTENERRVYHKGLYYTLLVNRNAYPDGTAYQHHYTGINRPCAAWDGMHWFGEQIPGRVYDRRER